MLDLLFIYLHPDLIRIWYRYVEKHVATIYSRSRNEEYSESGCPTDGRPRSCKHVFGPRWGMDLPSMMQQMMPIVSQALGGISSTSQLNPPSGSACLDSSLTRVNDEIEEGIHILTKLLSIFNFFLKSVV